jgi:cytochrome c5
MKRALSFTAGATVLALAIAIAIPATTGAEPLAGSASISADGQQMFMDQKCNLCHSVSTVGIEAKTKSEKMKGPDLVNLGQDAGLLTDYLKGDAEINGEKHKKKVKGSDEEIKALVDWILAQKN